MSDKYISVKVLEEIMRQHKPEHGQDKSKERYAYIEWLGILNAIRRECQPIEAVPVRKGHWFFSSTDFLTHCSACGTGKWKGYCPTPEEATEWMPICPHCGADMRGEDDHDAEE